MKTLNNKLIYVESDLDEISDEIFDPNGEFIQKHLQEYKAKVFIMGTGMGKTHNYWNVLVPILLELKVTTFLYDVPCTELLEPNVAKEALRNHGYTGKFRILTVDDMRSYEQYISDQRANKDRPITVMMLTDAFWASDKERREKYINYFKNLGERFSKFRDEIHHGGPSDLESSKDKNGVTRKEYVGAVANFQNRFLDAKTTPYIFCATATPFNEIVKLGLGTDNWQVANKPIAPSRVVSSQAHMKTPIWHNYTTRQDQAINNLLESSISKICDDDMIMRKLTPWIDESPTLFSYTSNVLKSKFSPKRTMMIKCQHFNRKDTNVDAKYITDILSSGIVPEGVQYLLDYSGSPHSTIKDQKKGWALRDHNGEIIRDSRQSGSLKNPWLKWMQDPNHPLRILVVIDKGTMGINIPNLSSLVSFRATSMQNDDGIITDSQIQNIGRFQRPNFGGLTHKNLKKMDNQLQNIIFEEMNQFDLIIPDAPSWRATIDRWVSDEGTPVSELWKYRQA